MDVLKIIGENIGALMQERSVSMRTLADAINVTHPTLSNYISGKSAIDSGKLFALAQYFNVDFDYFFNKREEACSLMFRAGNPAETFTEQDAQIIREKIREYIDLVGKDQFVAYIPQQYNLKIAGKKLSEEEKLYIKKVAKEQRKLLGIEAVIPKNYYEVFARNEINVMAFSLQNPNLDGCSYISREFGSLIFVNTLETIPEERQLFSLCHEYGHLLFHREDYFNKGADAPYKTARGNLNESVANLFAGYFLVPEELLSNCLNMEAYCEGGRIRMMALKKYFGVSYTALAMALHNYKIISDDVNNKIWALATQKGYRTQEPEPLPHISSTDKNVKIVNAIKSSFLEQEISVNKITEILGVSGNEARRLVKEWGNEFEKDRELEEALW